MRSPRTTRGFTLVEMMIVVAIIGVLSAVMFGLNSQTYGTSPMNVADQLSSGLNLCKMRAVSTQRWHRCEVTATSLTIEQWPSTGMAVPGVGTWSLVEQINLGAGVKIWGYSAAVCVTTPCAGAPASAAAFTFDIDYRPDGSSTGGTLYVTDPGGNKQYRVLAYKTTGTSYARQSW